MALPNKEELSTMDYAFLGAPFVNVEAKPLATESLDAAFEAQPFFGIGKAAINAFVKVSGVWKQAESMFVRNSGIWKQVDTVSVNDSGTWKS
jgi:hypothetical protein